MLAGWCCTRRACADLSCIEMREPAWLLLFEKPLFVCVLPVVLILPSFLPRLMRIPPAQVDSTGMMHYLHERITNSCPEELMLLEKAAQVGSQPAQQNLGAAIWLQ